MREREKQDLYIKSHKKWKPTAHLIKLQEELGELQAALSRSILSGNYNKDLFEEIAGVEITLEKVKLLFDQSQLKIAKNNQLLKLKQHLND